MPYLGTGPDNYGTLRPRNSVYILNWNASLQGTSRSPTDYYQLQPFMFADGIPTTRAPQLMRDNYFGNSPFREGPSLMRLMGLHCHPGRAKREPGPTKRLDPMGPGSSPLVSVLFSSSPSSWSAKADHPRFSFVFSFFY